MIWILFVISWRILVNTLPDNSIPKQEKLSSQDQQVRFPAFLLSSAPLCTVKLVDRVDEQTTPSKTRAELLADGQCEV